MFDERDSCLTLLLVLLAVLVVRLLVAAVVAVVVVTAFSLFGIAVSFWAVLFTLLALRMVANYFME